jgi:putative ABC transport system permease protein
VLGYGLFVPGVSAFGRVLSACARDARALRQRRDRLDPLVTPFARVLGWPRARFGGAAGRLARGNAVRMPGRTAATAAALMVGLALVTFVT